MFKNYELDFEKIMRYVLLALTIVGFFFSLKYTFENFTNPKNVNILLALPFIFFLSPYLILKLYSVKRVEAKMQVVPRFLRDIVDNVESGTDLVSAIKVTTRNEYGVLNEDILKLANQLSWGVDFDLALEKFAQNIGSSSLKRDIFLVIEARRVGGHVEKILREISLKINIDNLRKKERVSNLSSNTFTGYISFIIFVFIIILVYNNLFLGLGSALMQSSGGVGDITDNSSTNIYLTLLILLSYELAILSGFLYGLMQENNIIAGAPHVVALVVITFIGFFFFIQY